MKKNGRMKLPLIFFSAFIFIGLGVLSPLVLHEFNTTQELPSFAQVPDFSLTSSNSQPFGKQQLKGKIWVANFFFSSCQGPCPAMSAQMAKLAKAFKNDPQVHFISTTVDPKNRHPKSLRQLRKKNSKQTPPSGTFSQEVKKPYVNLVAMDLNSAVLKPPQCTAHALCLWILPQTFEATMMEQTLKKSLN